MNDSNAEADAVYDALGRTIQRVEFRQWLREHDAQVLRKAANRIDGEIGAATGWQIDPVSVQAARAWLRADADRIAEEE